MASTVADKSAAVLAMQPYWELARALLGGTRAMRAAGESLLPKWPNEDQKDYRFRLSVAVLFPAYKRTVETLTGKPFSKPVSIGDDVPSQLKTWLDDVDLQGRNLDAFASDQMECALGYGLSGILVDYPTAETVETNAAGVRTQASESAAGLRPYMVHIRPHQLLGWRAERSEGKWVLTQLRFMECVTEKDGEFGDAQIDQVRVLEPGIWRTYRKVKNATGAEEWALHKEGTTTLPVIPFVPVYGKRVDFMVGEPPLIEVAHLNVAHWQSASDQQTILHVARVPILCITGVDDEKWTLTVGSSAAVKLPASATMEFVEHTGAAIEAGRDDLKDLEERMRQAGAELLVLEPGKITATQVATENAVGMCALQRITLGLEDALDQALQLMADWSKLGQGGHVTLFNDFGAATLAEASAQLLLQANQAGKLSDETFHGELQRRGILSADIDWEEESRRLEEQGPALGELKDPDDPNPDPDPEA